MTTDASGTNIRSGPGVNFSIVKTLKSETGFIFHITGSQGDWVCVSAVNYIDGKNDRPLAGWIYAWSLFLKVESEYGRKQEGKFVSDLYAAPDWKARLLLSAKSSDERGESIGDIAGLRGCQGKWAKVYWKNKTMWLNPASQCSDLWDFCGER